MNDGTILLVVALFLGLPLAAFIFLKRRKTSQRDDPVTGERAYPNGTVEAQAWFTPILKGYGKGGIVSPGMPLHPAPAPEGGFRLKLPLPGQELDQLLFNPGSLAGKTRIRMRYRIDAAPGVEFRSVPDRSEPADAAWPAKMTLFIQRRGDDWSGKGKFASYRWVNYPASRNIEVGEHELIVSLTEGWTTIVEGGNPAMFDAAKADAVALGIVFGGNKTSIGHGMFATGDAVLTVTEFVVE